VIDLTELLKRSLRGGKPASKPASRDRAANDEGEAPRRASTPAKRAGTGAHRAAAKSERKSGSQGEGKSAKAPARKRA
jgi:hypothetical protein